MRDTVRVAKISYLFCFHLQVIQKNTTFAPRKNNRMVWIYNKILPPDGDF